MKNIDLLDFTINPAKMDADEQVNIYYCTNCGECNDKDGKHIDFDPLIHERIDIKKCQDCKNEDFADMIAMFLQSHPAIAKVTRDANDHQKSVKFFEATIVSDFVPTFRNAEITNVDFNNRTVIYMIKNSNLEKFM